MEMVFHVKKEDFKINYNQLLYHDGIDQLKLNYDPKTNDLIKDFFYFKKKLSKSKNLDESIISAINSINKIWVKTRHWEINFKNYNKYGIRFIIISIFKSSNF